MGGQSGYQKRTATRRHSGETSGHVGRAKVLTEAACITRCFSKAQGLHLLWRHSWQAGLTSSWINFWGRALTFRPPPLRVEDPYPTGRSPDPKSKYLCFFLLERYFVPLATKFVFSMPYANLVAGPARAFWWYCASIAKSNSPTEDTPNEAVRCAYNSVRTIIWLLG